MKWKATDFRVPDTTAACLLSTSAGPTWTRESTKFLRVAFRPADADRIVIPGSTITIVGDLVTERWDSTDAPHNFNYNAYPLGHSSNGAALLGGPQPTTFLPHRSSATSTWMNSLDENG